MPPLERVLIDYDLGLLRIIAAQWGLELAAANQRDTASLLAQAILNSGRIAEHVNALPAEARAALEAVRAGGGRLPRARFARVYGEVRAMGPARREREQPWRNAPSPAEVLWYYALTAHGFFESDGGPQEYTFIAEDLLKRLPPPPTPPAAPPPGRPAAIPAPSAAPSFSPSLADDVSTLLAYAQIVPLKLEGGSLTTRQPAAVRRFLHAPDALDLCFQLCLQLNLLSGAPLKPDPATARPFLELTRLAQTQTLAEAWRVSEDWNDLFRLPGLVFEGQAWRNDPAQARRAVLKLLAEVPTGEWWSLDAFVAALKERAPDFQRPAGDYDSWYIRDAETQAYLRGFEHWERVDGALVRWFLEGPLAWLGLVELWRPETPTRLPRRRGALRRASAGANASATAFRITSAGAAFLGHLPWVAVAQPAAATHVHLGTDGVIQVPAALSPYNRFRVARVTKWLGLDGDTYLYRLTPTSLRRAARQGVSLERLLEFLREAADEHGLPPLLLAALQRWARAGAEVAIEDLTVLRLSQPELLETLQRAPKIKPLLGPVLGPTAVAVRRDDVERLRAALAEAGFLSD